MTQVRKTGRRSYFEVERESTVVRYEGKRTTTKEVVGGQVRGR